MSFSIKLILFYEKAVEVWFYWWSLCIINTTDVWEWKGILWRMPKANIFLSALISFIGDTELPSLWSRQFRPSVVIMNYGSIVLNFRLIAQGDCCPQNSYRLYLMPQPIYVKGVSPTTPRKEDTHKINKSLSHFPFFSTQPVPQTKVSLHAPFIAAAIIATKSDLVDTTKMTETTRKFRKYLKICLLKPNYTNIINWKGMHILQL